MLHADDILVVVHGAVGEREIEGEGVMDASDARVTRDERAANK